MAFSTETVYQELHPYFKGLHPLGGNHRMFLKPLSLKDLKTVLIFNQFPPKGWRAYFKDRIARNEPLANHCAFGVGGPADIWISLSSLDELKGLVRLCAQEHWPLLIVGNGTNVLYADNGIRGIVAHVALDKFIIEEHGNSKALLIAEAGVSWPHLLRQLVPQGWAGLEFGAGIPGTLGGGVISNAGAHNSELGQVLEWIEVLDARHSGDENSEEVSLPLVRRYQHDELDLGYRHSRFRDQHRVRFDEQGHLLPTPRNMIEPGEIVMRLGINLHYEDPQKLHTIITENALYRKKTQPPYKYTGIIFKDPPGDTASQLIEAAGMKGRMLGQAQISTIDPNFIVNLGNAKAADIAALIAVMHRRVLEQSGIDLQVEVELRGEWVQSAAQVTR